MSPEDIEDIAALQLDLYIHSCYLNHLWSDRKQVRSLSKHLVKTELTIADRLEAKGLVVHIKDDVSPNDILDTLNGLSLEQFSTKVHLENMYRVEYRSSYSNLVNLDFLFDKMRSYSFKNQVRYCLDTSHLWASGFSVNDSNDINSYLKKIKPYRPVIHFNDNKNNRGSLKDNHAPIGEGKIWGDNKAYLNIIDSGYPLILESSNYPQDFALLEKYLQ